MASGTIRPASAGTATPAGDTSPQTTIGSPGRAGDDPILTPGIRHTTLAGQVRGRGPHVAPRSRVVRAHSGTEASLHYEVSVPKVSAVGAGRTRPSLVPNHAIKSNGASSKSV